MTIQGTTLPGISTHSYKMMNPAKPDGNNRGLEPPGRKTEGKAVAVELSDAGKNKSALKEISAEVRGTNYSGVDVQNIVIDIYNKFAQRFGNEFHTESFKDPYVRSAFMSLLDEKLGEE